MAYFWLDRLAVEYRNATMDRPLSYAEYAVD